MTDLEKVVELLSLVDGAMPAVELFQADSPSQKIWQKDWLSRARRMLQSPEEKP